VIEKKVVWGVGGLAKKNPLKSFTCLRDNNGHSEVPIVQVNRAAFDTLKGKRFFLAGHLL